MTKSAPQAASLQQEIGKTTPFERPEEEAYLNLVRTANVLETAHHKFFSRYRVSAANYNVLRILRGSGERGKTCSEISADLVAQGPDTTRLVDRLVTKGLVERERTEEDRRVVRVKITSAGLELLEQMDRPLINLTRGQLAALSSNELTELSRLLVKARSNQ